MIDMTNATNEVLEAAQRLVDAFARFDRATYFASFDEGASFIFYNSEVSFDDRDSYERAWDDWVADGWQVLRCRSVGAKVRLLDDYTAVFTHEVFTTLGPVDDPTDLHERETIVFSKRAPGWRAVHEHLSPYPEQS
jgi:ketosteroid isomerase-like protein